MVSMFDYMESRGGRYPATVFFGLQYYLRTYLSKPIEQWEIEEAYNYAINHGVPFDLEGWNYIVDKLNGYLPIEIKAVQEGTLVPTGHVLMTIESTDANVPWIAGWLETLLTKIWYPTTIATKAYYTKQMLQKHGSVEWASFAYHNFGDRGSSSVESAAIGGVAHMTSFMGTDNFNSLKLAHDYYEAEIAGFSVYATEHSSTTSHGKDSEEAFVLEQLRQNPIRPIMSFVADSYDVYKFTDFCSHPNSEIRKLIESRPNQTFVLRPDSGDPFKVVERMLLILLDNEVAKTFDSNNRILFTDYRILWGDGITPEIIDNILTMVTNLGYAAENFVFGSGGDLMQNLTRDTQKFAVKCSSISLEHGDPINGDALTETMIRDREVFKDPITDPGKKSKKGKLCLIQNLDSGEYLTINVGDPVPAGWVQALQVVYYNGELMREFTLDEIRKNVQDN
jgi:nicotinamide phosphoribosyltransferase